MHTVEIKLNRPSLSLDYNQFNQLIGHLEAHNITVYVDSMTVTIVIALGGLQVVQDILEDWKVR